MTIVLEPNYQLKHASDSPAHPCGSSANPVMHVPCIPSTNGTVIISIIVSQQWQMENKRKRIKIKKYGSWLDPETGGSGKKQEWLLISSVRVWAFQVFQQTPQLWGFSWKRASLGTFEAHFFTASPQQSWGLGEVSSSPQHSLWAPWIRTCHRAIYISRIWTASLGQLFTFRANFLDRAGIATSCFSSLLLSVPAQRVGEGTGFHTEQSSAPPAIHLDPRGVAAFTKYAQNSEWLWPDT